MWDAETGARLATVGPDPQEASGFTQLAWYGPDEIVTFAARELRITNASTGEVTYRASSLNYGPGGSAGVIATNVEADRLVTGGVSQPVRIWDPSSDLPFGEARPSFNTPGVAIDPAGSTVVAAGDDGDAVLYDISTLTEPPVLSYPNQPVLLGELVGHTGPLVAVTFSPDGTLVATTSEDGTARIWSVAEQAEVLTFSDHSGKVVDVEFSPDGSLVATAGTDGRVLVWTANTGDVVLSLTGHAGQIGQLSWHPHRAELAVGSGGGVTQVFDLSESGRKELLTIDADASGIGRADLSPDGELIAAVGR